MRTIALAALALLSGCGQADPPVAAPTCASGLEKLHDRCVEPRTRYEPDERLDHDNVVGYGEAPASLELPEPPKSGFRLWIPAAELAAGEERTLCVSWPFPALERTLVYSARLYTTPGLHHSNVFSNPIDAELGENPYPGCHPGAEDAFAQVDQGIPDALFANSTQVIGHEDLVFSAGMGYRLHLDREITASVHLLNTTGEPIVAEVAYDFFTMPEEELAHELAAFVVDDRLFDVPPQATETTSAECAVWDGTIVSLMPHTHDFSVGFDVELLDESKAGTSIYSEQGYDLESDIAIFDPGIDLGPVDWLRLSCTYKNTKSTNLQYGLGDGEMCILFGYLYPVEEQFAAYQRSPSEGCVSIKIGLFQ
jgi:hypothetical protein